MPRAKDSRPSAESYQSWITPSMSGDQSGASRAGEGVGRLGRLVRFSGLVRSDGTSSWPDAVIAMIGVLILDGLAFLGFSGWQSLQCGGDCGLRSQLHLLRVGTVIVLVVVAVPIVIALVLRRQRVAVIIVQLALCALLLPNNLSSRARVSARLNGTATCWSTLYSNANCPWGNKN